MRGGIYNAMFHVLHLLFTLCPFRSGRPITGQRGHSRGGLRRVVWRAVHIVVGRRFVVLCSMYSSLRMDIV